MLPGSVAVLPRSVAVLSSVIVLPLSVIVPPKSVAVLPGSAALFSRTATVSRVLPLLLRLVAVLPWCFPALPRPATVPRSSVAAGLCVVCQTPVGLTEVAAGVVHLPS